MDVLEEQAQLGPSLGQKFWQDAMTQTLEARQRMDVAFGGKGEDLGIDT